MSMLYVVAQSKQLEIPVKIFHSEEIEGYTEDGVIYLSDECDNVEKVFKHEVMHLYEDTIAFKMVKESILSILTDKEKQRLIDEYSLRYEGVYSKQQIDEGILETEIAIDMIIENGQFNDEITDFCEGLYEKIIKSEKRIPQSTRFLNLSLSQKIEQQYPQASIWEKLFILNYYDGQKHKQPMKKESKYQDLRKDIESALNKLYLYAEDEENFRIYVHNNIELEREYQSKIKALKARGEYQLAEKYKHNKWAAIKAISKKISKTHQAEYKHIVDFIKTADYEPAFKILMLNETLTKTYKQEKDEYGEVQTIVKKRDCNRTIAGHMTLNSDVLRVIYTNLTSYSSFANLYFLGLSEYNKKIAQKSGIEVENINTFNMGKWLKFEGKQSNEKAFIKNSQKLAALVQNTPWCTKTLASSQLEQGDFFVFVDNTGNPHIAVKMNGNEIDEMRGIKDGNAQKIEENYLEVAREFFIQYKYSLRKFKKQNQTYQEKE